ncbi:MAG: hypothetical protein ABIS67_01730, partial [Candidatus Eisenbacteria bacterium]
MTAALLTAIAPMAGAATTITWNNAAGGLWSDANNWTPANVPDAAGEEAVLPVLLGDYRVTLDVNPAVDRIGIAAGDPTLDLNSYSIGAVPLVENSGTIRRDAGNRERCRDRIERAPVHQSRHPPDQRHRSHPADPLHPVPADRRDHLA